MALVVTPSELTWRPQDAVSKSIYFTNTGPGDLWLEIPGAPRISSSEFVWGGSPRHVLNPSIARPVGLGSAVSGRPPVPVPRTAVISVTVTPPFPGANAGVKTAAVPFTVTDNTGRTVQAASISCRNDAQSKVLFGDLQIIELMSNPPGPDIAPEGEFIDVLNVTSQERDLAGCGITQQLFGQTNVSRTVPQSPGTLVTFPGPGAFNRSDFGKTSRLPAGARLRILTRKKASTDPAHDPLRYYAGFDSAVWNNTGDRATIYNAENEPIATFGYGSQANGAGLPGTTPPIRNEPPRQLVAAFSVDINATFGFVPVTAIEDGDEVEISTEDTTLARNFVRSNIIGLGVVGNAPFSPGYLPSGRPLNILPRRIGNAVPAPNSGDWPLPGAAKYSLIGALDQNGTGAFAIGAGHTLTATLDRPRMLHLGINDDVLWDNRGVFRAFIRIFRR